MTDLEEQLKSSIAFGNRNKRIGAQQELERANRILSARRRKEAAKTTDKKLTIEKRREAFRRVNLLDSLMRELYKGKE